MMQPARFRSSECCNMRREARPLAVVGQEVPELFKVIQGARFGVGLLAFRRCVPYAVDEKVKGTLMQRELKLRLFGPKASVDTAPLGSARPIHVAT